MENRYITLACEYLGIVAGQVINPRIEDGDLVLVYDLGIKGCPKRRIPLEVLDALQFEGEPEWEEMVAVENPDWDGEPEPGLLEVAVDATDAALRLMEENRIDAADVLFMIGKERRINARDVRRYIKEGDK